MFENRALSRIMRNKRDEVTVEWRKLHNEWLNVLFIKPTILRENILKNEMGGTCSAYVEGRFV